MATPQDLPRLGRFGPTPFDVWVSRHAGGCDQQEDPMPKYVFAYHGGKMAETPDEQAKVMDAWTSWFGSLGGAVVDGGNPTGASKTVGAGGATTDGGGANPLSGYSLISADSLDAAATLAKGCPILDAGGTVEVAEAIEM
jgi:hypothetical protein